MKVYHSISHTSFPPQLLTIWVIWHTTGEVWKIDGFNNKLDTINYSTPYILLSIDLWHKYANFLYRIKFRGRVVEIGIFYRRVIVCIRMMRVLLQRMSQHRAHIPYKSNLYKRGTMEFMIVRYADFIMHHPSQFIIHMHLMSLFKCLNSQHKVLLCLFNDANFIFMSNWLNNSSFIKFKLLFSSMPLSLSLFFLTAAQHYYCCKTFFSFLLKNNFYQHNWGEWSGGIKHAKGKMMRNYSSGN